MRRGRGFTRVGLSPDSPHQRTTRAPGHSTECVAWCLTVRGAPLTLSLSTYPRSLFTFLRSAVVRLVLCARARALFPRCKRKGERGKRGQTIHPTLYLALGATHSSSHPGASRVLLCNAVCAGRSSWRRIRRTARVRWSGGGRWRARRQRHRPRRRHTTTRAARPNMVAVSTPIPLPPAAACPKMPAASGARTRLTPQVRTVVKSDVRPSVRATGVVCLTNKGECSERRCSTRQHHTCAYVRCARARALSRRWWRGRRWRRRRRRGRRVRQSVCESVRELTWPTAERSWWQHVCVCVVC